MTTRLRRWYLLSVCMLCTGLIQAQDLSGGGLPGEQKYSPTTGIRAAYVGAILFPGVKAGVERPYTYTQIDRVKPQKTKTFYRERYLSYSLGMYHHPTFHSHYFLQTEWIARRQKSNGFYREGGLGLGLSRTFVDGAAFSVSDNGEVVKEPMSGNWYGLATVSGGFGYNARMKSGKPYSVYLKNQLLFFFPHNSLVNLRPTIEIGFNYHVSGSGFWGAAPRYQAKVKQRSKSRKG